MQVSLFHSLFLRLHSSESRDWEALSNKECVAPYLPDPSPTSHHDKLFFEDFLSVDAVPVVRSLALSGLASVCLDTPPLAGNSDDDDSDLSRGPDTPIIAEIDEAIEIVSFRSDDRLDPAVLETFRDARVTYLGHFDPTFGDAGAIRSRGSLPALKRLSKWASKAAAWF